MIIGHQRRSNIAGGPEKTAFLSIAVLNESG
jgi:hypothetical protein